MFIFIFLKFTSRYVKSGFIDFSVVLFHKKTTILIRMNECHTELLQTFLQILYFSLLRNNDIFNSDTHKIIMLTWHYKILILIHKYYVWTELVWCILMFRFLVSSAMCFWLFYKFLFDYLRMFHVWTES